jgi:FkbH-like protein
MRDKDGNRYGVNLGTLSLEEIFTRRKALKRRLSEREDLQSIRIAVLGGSTTNELVDLLELWLLENGFRPAFHQSEYGRYYDDAVHDSAALVAFRPDIVYVHTSVLNIRGFAPLESTHAEADECVRTEFNRFRAIWDAVAEKLGCLVIQNNFEFPPQAILGNLDGASPGRTWFVRELNREFALAAVSNPKLLLQDICSISARIGLAHWFDWTRYYSYKILTTPEGSRAIAVSLAAVVRAVYGKTRKVLVLDLDNTLWGGVIGDDGVEKIQIGRENPVAEAYTAFQEYALALRARGVLLAVCSKNDRAAAEQGFEHPDSILRSEHISAFKANWDPKPDNIVAIAKELNLGTESFVFVDDNPAEREIVEGQVPGIAVPNVGSDVSGYPDIIEAGRYFEQISFSKEDIQRAALYQENLQRATFEQKFSNYGEYLDSLEMTAEIERFNSLYLERITQLTNKTNQFNLTTRRYSRAEMEDVLRDANAIGIYGKLSDRFGDNGLISVVLGHRTGCVLDIDLWLMSCRVLKRDMEFAMLDELVEHCREVSVKTLRGHYLPTKKNGMVADHYKELGFETVLESGDGSKVYSLDIEEYRPRNRHIKLLEPTRGK